MMLRAIDTMEFVHGNLASLAGCREAALFDPEFGQWHFVSLDGLVK